LIVFLLKIFIGGAMKKNCCLVVLLFYLFLPLEIFSQERQIPIDPANNIKVIDKELEKSLNLFPEYTNFEEAKLYQKGDTSYILEIYYFDKGDLVKDRKDITYHQVNELREKIRELILSKSMKLNINQDGRPFFIGGTTALSIYYAIGLGEYINASSNVRAAIVPLTMGAGFFAPFYLTMNKEVTNGMSNLAIWSGVLGIFYGYAVNHLVGIESSKSEAFILPTITSLSGLVGGYFYAKSNKISEGKAKSIVNLSGLGAPYLLGLTYVIIGEKVTPKQLAGGFILGGVGGAFLGNFLSNKFNFAPGDASVFSTTALLATAETGAILMAAKVDDSRLDVGALLLGATLGGLRGGILVNKYDFSNAQANYLILGTAGGTLIGSGICLLLFKDYNDAIPIITMLFGELGFDITFFAITKKQKKDEDNTGKLNFNLNPFALIYKPNEFTKTTFNQIPFLTISYRW